MSVPASEARSISKQTGPWLAVAGCGITFMLTVLGAAIGGWIGWLTSPPQPPHVNEYSGLNEFFETIFHLGGGLVGGGVLGLLVGIAVSVMLVRRVNATTKPEDASHG